MATQQPSPALPAPAPAAPYPMAKPGYGKRSTPGQQPRTRNDFALLPTRERYVAGFIDHLPDGAAMSVKQLAKQLPLYGQQAISTALNALSVAGHLRRVRCSVGAGDETRWVFRTFWSRTAHDNEWWNTYLATETAAAAATATEASGAPEDAEAPEAPEVAQAAQVPQTPRTEQAPPDPTDVPTPSPAYLALARLGRQDPRLALSANDCAALEARAAQWLDRGVGVDYLTAALTAGLPAEVDSPVALLRHRLTTKVPPPLPAESTAPGGAPPGRRLLVECTKCRTPGPSEALPDGLCRPCRSGADGPRQRTRDDGLPVQRDISAYVSELRGRLKLP
ncbi:MarR family transcriptional regulator [Streptomyces griseus]|uniref:MarR family transcriptional regulator n=1 Tax=Streptomyces stephensoniae TaxID=3375367 RepID=A0ABU2W0I7_9ACTN|nr:MarR family transcriptional regulator [Streptomyces griseus]MDT0490839.1 MarR family transcriptional regulator [Streptomyces griseus]